MVFHFLYAGTWVHLNRIRADLLPPWKWTENKNPSISWTREDLIIMLSFLRMSSKKLPFSTPRHIAKWALRRKTCSPPQMMMFIAACYLLNQWLPVWSSLIESLSHRSHLETVNHWSDLMSLYCQRCVWMASGATQAAGCLATEWY